MVESPPPHSQDEPPRWHWWRGHEKDDSPTDEEFSNSSSASGAPPHRDSSAESDTTEHPHVGPTPTGETAGGYTDIPKFENLIADPRIADADNATKKRWVQQELRQAKYDIQGSDYDHIKAITDAGGSTPWRTNKNWHNAQKEYKAAWRDLRTWAKEQGVWDEKKDEIECMKETGAGKDWGMRETARAIGINIAMGGLYGLGYALIAPWKAFELGLKYASSLTGDDPYTKDMMEKMFPKRKPSERKGKEIKPDRAAEEKTRKEIKKMTRDYVLGLKGTITNGTKLKSLHGTEAYRDATETARTIMEDDISNKAYQEVWRDLRIDWVKEEIWNQEDENLFITEMGYSSDTYNPLYIQDFLTEGEWEDLRWSTESLNKKNAILETTTKESVKINLKEEIPELEKKIEKLKNRAESRFDAHSWPPYYKEKGRNRRRNRMPSTDDEGDE